VCDDDLPFIRYVERALKLVDVEVTPITTLAQDEALRVLASSGADAALLDLHMYDDGDAGFRLVEAARANPATARMPLYLSTGDARAVQRNLALLQSHDCHLLLKPFGLDELLAALHLQHRTFAA
jgi:CheY-like chemotaxis protein